MPDGDIHSRRLERLDSGTAKPGLGWDGRCAEILRRNAPRYTNAEIAALIEAATGKRFSACTVSRRRAALGLDCPNRNDWTAPLRRWSARRERDFRP